MKIKTGKEEALRAAEYFGAEYQANPGSSRMEYYESIAEYYGHKKWSDLSASERDDAVKAFNKGVKAEKELQKQGY